MRPLRVAVWVLVGVLVATALVVADRRALPGPTAATGSAA
ncbi:MAG: hypothetical protein JWR62_2827, partial [Modestobacter sp.]|nr:hypothetical protein [Modestobacter sp.]